jgi:hypothetical protein
LENDTAWAKEGALLTAKTVPECFIIGFFGFQDKMLDNPAGGAVIGILTIKIEHGANGRTLSTLYTKMEIVLLNDSLECWFKVR